MYNVIVKPLEFFYELWPNYAAAIALLTLSIMVLLLPLTLKGTRSMLAMQKLQPELKKLQNKHRDDRQKMNEEVMKFYKENNINPMSGCLPLLLQMPVFFILYRTLYDLLHRAPYGQDMGSAAAQYVNGGGTFGGFGDFYPKHLSSSSALYQDLHQTNEMRSLGINLAESAQKAFSRGISTAWPYIVLVLFVAGTSYYQQRQIAGRANQANVNPQQQMLMKIMPLFFAFISLTLPAGIVVYFLVSNTFRIGQQAFITRTMYREDDGTVATTGRESDKTSTPKKGFMEQFREIAPSPSKAKEDFKDKPGAGGAKKGSSTKTTTKPSATARPGAKPSRQAPSSANRSRTKKKRK